jgi:hypothetical protein
MPVVTTGLTADDCDYAMIQNANYIIQNCIPSLTCSSLMVDATSGTAPIDGTAVFLATFLHAGTVAIALDKGAVDLNRLQTPFSTKLHTSADMVPVRRVLPRCYSCKFDSSPSVEGIFPERLFQLRCSFVKLAKAPSSLGSLPVNALNGTESQSNLVSKPSSVGSWPFRALLFIERVISSDADPRDDGISPDKRLLNR